MKNSNKLHELLCDNPCAYLAVRDLGGGVDVREIVKESEASAAREAGYTLTPLVPMRELDRLVADAGRYRWLQNRTRGTATFGVQEFVLPRVEVLDGQNIMRGSVAQHLDAAIDAARAEVKS